MSRTLRRKRRKTTTATGSSADRSTTLLAAPRLRVVDSRIPGRTPGYSPADSKPAPPVGSRPVVADSKARAVARSGGRTSYSSPWRARRQPGPSISKSASRPSSASWVIAGSHRGAVDSPTARGGWDSRLSPTGQGQSAGAFTATSGQETRSVGAWLKTLC
jgi:hypothetical protein